MDTIPTKSTKRRVIIISNRLPVNVSKNKDSFEIQPSPGGLATGLSSFHRNNGGVWIGWPGISPTSELEKQSLQQSLLADYQCYPVFLSSQEIKRYYDGFSNNTLWPLFHYFPARCTYETVDWEFYQRVNQKFLESAMTIIRPGDIIWIHDYHLLLLPQLIRNAVPEASIGFFLHIPFPSMEVFRYLPWRNELLEGMLGADLIGFHTYDYSRHFLSSVLRILGKDHNYGKIIVDSRLVSVDSFPMGIDAAKFSEAVNTASVKEEIAKLKLSLKTDKIVLSVDRLDFTKGIPERIKAYELFLKKYPEWFGKITYVMLCVPSRNKIYQYQLLKREVDELVGRINGRYGNPEWTPIIYMYRSVPFDTLVALYALADLALVTPLRDGMNLVAKEYIACQNRLKKGMLILSETAGAAAELGESIIINPNNADGIATAIYEGLALSNQDKSQAIQLMAKRIHDYNIFRWGEDFIENLINVKENQAHERKFLIRGKLKTLIVNQFVQAKQRLLLLDYDGTLVSFAKKPELACPDSELLAILTQLAAHPLNTVAVISGRDREFLSKWLDRTGVDLVAEHGTWIKEAGQQWELQVTGVNDEWKEIISPIMERFTERAPGSFIEEKSLALVWHYRKAEPEQGSLKSKELIDALHSHTAGTGLQVLLGQKVVEVKPIDIHKGKGVLHYLEKSSSWDFILGMGDDYTDEDLFGALPENAWAVKIGYAPFTKARYYMESCSSARELLNSLLLQKNECELP